MSHQRYVEPRSLGKRRSVPGGQGRQFSDRNATDKVREIGVSRTSGEE